MSGNGLLLIFAAIIAAVVLYRLFGKRHKGENIPSDDILPSIGSSGSDRTSLHRKASNKSALGQLEVTFEGEEVSVANTTGSHRFEIVGEGRYQDALSRLTGGPVKSGRKQKKTAHLVRERDNPHDENAVAVHINGEVVGYLDRASARHLRKQVEGKVSDDTPIVCPALVVGGWDRGGGDVGHFGVKLDLPTP